MNRVGVFGAREPSQGDATGIAGLGAGDVIEPAGDSVCDEGSNVAVARIAFWIARINCTLFALVFASRVLTSWRCD